MVLRDGLEGGKEGGVGKGIGKAGAKSSPVSVVEVPEKERKKAANSLLFSELGLPRNCVRGVNVIFLGRLWYQYATPFHNFGHVLHPSSSDCSSYGRCCVGVLSSR